MKKYKLLYFVSEDEYFLSHKINQVKTALEMFDILVVTKFSSHERKIQKHGFQTFHLDFNRKSLNLLSNFKVLKKFLQIISKFKPDMIQSIALKPIIFTAIASLTFKNKVKCLHCVVGLGYLFINKTMINLIIKKIYFFLLKLSLNKYCYFVFQNNDDVSVFKKLGILKKQNFKIIRGSGVNEIRFKKNIKIKKEFDLIFHSRILIDKGIFELISALKILRQKNLFFKTLILGLPDSGNNSSVSTNLLKIWNKEKLIIWKKKVTNVIPYLNSAKVAVLPSYREGFPKSLLEAASCELAIITCDVPGCRDICVNNKNGILVKPRDSISLSKAIKKIFSKKSYVKKFGKKGRELVKKHYTDKKISNEFLLLYKKLLKKT